MGTTDNFDVPAAATVAETDTIPTLNTGTSRGASATVAQIRAAALAPVNTTATTLALTAALHAGRVVTVSSAAPIAITLPASAGTGQRYLIQVQVAATATASTIKVANATDIMQGFVLALTTSSDNVIGYKATATDDTISVNGTTKGGVAGDWVELIDVKTGFWMVKMRTAPTGSTATPFSATV